MKQEIIFSRYAIFTTGGKQYQALEGKTVAIEKIDQKKEGDSVEFDTLLVKNGEGDVKIGQPYLSTSVKATIVKHMKGPKVVIFKFKRRKKSRVKRGHRQPMTIVRVDSF